MIKIKRVLADKTVDQILSVFNKTIEQLEKVSSQNKEIVGNNLEEIAALEAQNRVAQAEAEKANSVINKIKQLIS